MAKRTEYQVLMSRLNEQRKFIQILEGPRQVGKTTLIKQVLQEISKPWLMYSADIVPASRPEWISECWFAARHKMQTEQLSELVLVIDEIQLIQRWSSYVKKEWDADSFNDVNLKVVLLGSSRVMLERGLSESLMGRFELIKLPHWSYTEMRDAFGFSLSEYIYYGGYPGAASLRHDQDRWRDYIRSAIVDATINKDILVDAPIGKPALFRQTFELSAVYSGKILSYTKMLGQLQDAGNTTTLVGYLDVLNRSGLAAALPKFAIDQARRKGSIPKFQVYNNALMNIYSGQTYEESMAAPKQWGHIFESAVGAYIINDSYVHGIDVFYWREGNNEVDFVLSYNGKVVALEVKSNDQPFGKGLQYFDKLFHPHRSLIIGEGGLPAENFFSAPLTALFD